LFTRNGKSLTAKGVKPICTVQQVFQSTYLFGAFSPITGDSFLLELPNCCNDTFQIFLNDLSNQKPNELKVIVLDNGAFHKAKALIVPDSIILVFLPPYCPELNPAERIWQLLKRDFTNVFLKNLDELSNFISKTVLQLSTNIVKSISRYSYIFFNDFWTIL